VLVTNLANQVQPIIRYEIGDIVTMGTEPCGCGSRLPLVASVEGRDSDMFWIKGDEGIRPLWPAVFEVAIGRIIDVREYQIVQEDRRRFRILLEPLPGVKLDRGRADKMLREQLDEYGLDDHLHVDLEVVDRLAPEGGEKFKRVISKVPPPKDGRRKADSRRQSQDAGRVA
jgi:phenylacetate-coenzyme A ligase PaaK-like adenylate-forming protein